MENEEEWTKDESKLKLKEIVSSANVKYPTSDEKCHKLFTTNSSIQL